MSLRHGLLLLLFGVLLAGCSAPGYFEYISWEGRWTDGTGYWVEIDSANGSYVLKRSGGGAAQLTFLEVSADNGQFKYREGDSYIHTLTLRSQNVIRDKWLELPKKKVWRVDYLYRDPDH